MKQWILYVEVSIVVRFFHWNKLHNICHNNQHIYSIVLRMNGGAGILCCVAVIECLALIKLEEKRVQSPFHGFDCSFIIIAFWFYGNYSTQLSASINLIAFLTFNMELINLPLSFNQFTMKNFLIDFQRYMYIQRVLGMITSLIQWKYRIIFTLNRDPSWFSANRCWIIFFFFSKYIS